MFGWRGADGLARSYVGLCPGFVVFPGTILLLGPVSTDEAEGVGLSVVRYEALFVRMEVGDLRRLGVVAVG